MTWIEHGDANSKLFHNYASARCNGNTIWEVMDLRGNHIHEDAQLKVAPVDYFSQVFKEEEPAHIQDQLRVLKRFPKFLSSDET